MPSYAYIARSKAGERAQGNLEAPDRRSALLALERKGLVPVSVTEAGLGAASAKTDKKIKPAAASKKPKKAQAEGSPAITFGRKKTRMSMREVLIFTRELGDLLNSGMTLGNALNTLSRRKTKSAADEIVIKLRDEIIKGASLSEALAQYPDSFSTLYVSMVRAGEASGAVSESLERLAFHYDRVLDAREKVMTAMTYPSIVLAAGFLTIVFVMTFVIPKFSVVFAELGATLPLPTRILIGSSSFVLSYGWLLAIGLIAGFIFFRRYIRTERGELWWHGKMLRFPVIHRIVTANAYGQFARTLGALLHNGVPVLQALSIVENTVGNKVIAREVHEARDRVTDGSTIAGPLAAGNVFPPLLTDMLAVGEESGDMAGALGHIAERYDKELDRSVKVLTTVLEPVMILVIAVGVGFVAISMLMAVFELTSGLNV
ncbi:MAG TPA: type II secretion system F family protein [Kiritimatiellia bacterium]|nr:type II secretion system F family protein [Kiritimatiellia bacterium]HMO98202.1 type II secretion system F family protein [Kiritimatiellia bacterium]HMP96480.1 type II secretion system F family protein [Kiritimatiellia bacterium]